MRIFMTGGTGYIGTELTLSLMANPEIEEIIIFDNLSRKNYNFFIGERKLLPKVKFVHGELLDSRKLRRNIKAGDTVIHLAARVSTPFADQNPHLFDQINNWGTAELMYACEEAGAGQVIYLSSASVYGATEGEVNKSLLPNPRTFYGISKLKGEKHVARLSSKIPVAIVRCGNVYGYSKSMRFDAVINRFVVEGKFNQRITINGDGNQHRSFVHINRATEFLRRLVEARPPEVYFDLVEQVLSVNEIAYTLQELLPEMEMIFVDQQVKLREIRVSPDKAVEELIGKPKSNLKAELQDMLNNMA